MKTTLQKIWDKDPCQEGWLTLTNYLGKTEPDDEPIDIVTIIDSNGIEDAIWALRAVEGKNKEIRLFAVWCARQVQHLTTDLRSLDALVVAEKYANGLATCEELYAASAAAWDAARAAAWDAASAAARAAASAAAWAAAWYAAWHAAWAAACDAANGAASGAASGAAWDAARAAQEAELRRICAQC